MKWTAAQPMFIMQSATEQILAWPYQQAPQRADGWSGADAEKRTDPQGGALMIVSADRAWDRPWGAATTTSLWSTGSRSDRQCVISIKILIYCKSMQSHLHQTGPLQFRREDAEMLEKETDDCKVTWSIRLEETSFKQEWSVLSGADHSQNSTFNVQFSTDLCSGQTLQSLSPRQKTRLFFYF